MRTHELAKALAQLSRLLTSMPNMELDEFGTRFISPLEKSRETVSLNLATLAALSRTTKQEWAEIILSYGFPIELRSSYSARDLMDKVLKYLASNPEAMRGLQRTTAKTSRKSQSLLSILNLLIDEE